MFPPYLLFFLFLLISNSRNVSARIYSYRGRPDVPFRNRKKERWLMVSPAAHNPHLIRWARRRCFDESPFVCHFFIFIARDIKLIKNETFSSFQKWRKKSIIPSREFSGEIVSKRARRVIWCRISLEIQEKRWKRWALILWLLLHKKSFIIFSEKRSTSLENV